MSLLNTMLRAAIWTVTRKATNHAYDFAHKKVKSRKQKPKKAMERRK